MGLPVSEEIGSMKYLLALVVEVFDGGDTRLIPAIEEWKVWIEEITKFRVMMTLLYSDHPSKPSPYDNGYQLTLDAIDWNEIPDSRFNLLLYHCKDIPVCPIWGGATWPVMMTDSLMTITTIAYSPWWTFEIPAVKEGPIRTSIGAIWMHEFNTQVAYWLEYLGYKGEIKSQYQLFDEGIGNTDATRDILDKAFWAQVTDEMYAKLGKPIEEGGKVMRVKLVKIDDNSVLWEGIARVTDTEKEIRLLKIPEIIPPPPTPLAANEFYPDSIRVNVGIENTPVDALGLISAEDGRYNQVSSIEGVVDWICVASLPQGTTRASLEMVAKSTIQVYQRLFLFNYQLRIWQVASEVWIGRKGQRVIIPIEASYISPDSKVQVEISCRVQREFDHETDVMRFTII